MTIKFLTYTFLFLVTVSCNTGSEKSNVRSVPGSNEMAEMNRYLVQKDRERIENYIDRKNLDMTESPTGLWYFIKKEGQGSYITDNDKIVIEYNCSLLDGTICYSSEKDGVKEIVLGRSELEAGLNQGLRMLRTGGEAVFIIPPFLAYGFTGDGEKIPSRAVIVYNVNILQVHKFVE
ncbi:MAG: FKBP-type peptidyl-prolyl cis-trans isomerase [Bacteroidales bacterium]|nr:FKBP-type peptidyl-prolyl cis-trans isomerase [Bacteroidales bacterium]